MTKVKGAKKKFFEVKLPLTATKVHVLGYALEELPGKVVKLDMTKSFRGKNVELRARIVNVNGALEGKPESLEVLPTYIRKTIRKGTDYVEDSFEVQCKDAMLRIKPFMVTRKHVSRAIRNELRSQTRKHLEAHIKIRTSEEVLSEVMTNKIQKEVSLKLKKIYPLGFCEIRKVEIIKKEETQEAK